MRYAANRAKIGEVHNRLTIISDTGQKTAIGAVKWLCSCVCGKTTIAIAAELRNGSKKSCGCLNDEIRKKTHRKPEGFATYTQMYRNYKGGAARRGLQWDLSLDQFIKLVSQPCYYSGTLPKKTNAYIKADGTVINKNRGPSNEGVERSWIYANGIDRINSNIGYIIDNCRPCCKTCNFMKGELSAEDFLTQVSKINNNRIKNEKY